MIRSADIVAMEKVIRYLDIFGGLYRYFDYRCGLSRINGFQQFRMLVLEQVLFRSAQDQQVGYELFT